jgi:Na+/H+ antiporter NhaD/arsenite permease-like protein
MEENINNNKVEKLPVCCAAWLPAGICPTVSLQTLFSYLLLLLCILCITEKRAGHGFARVNGQTPIDSFIFFLSLFSFINKRQGRHQKQKFLGLDPGDD